MRAQQSESHKHQGHIEKKNVKQLKLHIQHKWGPTPH